MSVGAERRGLGRGLGELFQRTEPRENTEASEPAPAHPVPEGSYFAEIDANAVTPNPKQPRTVFDEDAMAELVASIEEVGLLQPIVVRPIGDGKFELVMGERRWRASQQANLEKIPAIVRETKAVVGLIG